MCKDEIDNRQNLNKVIKSQEVINITIKISESGESSRISIMIL